MNPETEHLINELHLAAARVAGALVEEIATVDPSLVHRVDRAVAAGAHLAVHHHLGSGRVELRLAIGDTERALVAHEPGERPAKN